MRSAPSTAWAAVLALGVSAYAGETTGGSPFRQEGFLEELDKALSLEDDQKKKIEGVLNKSHARDKKKIAELEKLKKRMRILGRELRRSRQETREAIREQLTLDQKERFDAMTQRLRRGREDGDAPGEGGGRMRGIDVDPRELPPELRERMRRGERQFPPEMWHREQQGRGDDLPPEIRERIRERMERRLRQGEGSQRDVPPPDQWHDRRRFFEGGPRPNDADED